MIRANSGSDAESAGSTVLKGSNDTVTKCRFATAKTMRIRPSGRTIRTLRNFRMRIARVDRNYRPDLNIRCREPAANCGRISDQLHGASRNMHSAQMPHGNPTPASRSGFRMVAVQPLPHFLAGLEERDGLLVDRHVGTGARIASGPRRAVLDGERPETTQLHPVAARQRRHDFIEDRVHNVLDVPLVEMRVVLGDTLNQFGF